jgi:ParB family chromosome partitioning protein
LVAPTIGIAQENWSNRDGHLIVRIKNGKRAFSLSIDQKAAPDFGEFLISRLDGLYAEYVADRPPKRD